MRVFNGKPTSLPVAAEAIEGKRRRV